MAKNTVLTLQQQKLAGDKICQVTAYDYTMACLVEEAGLEMILVGDSLGMVMMGYADTLPVTMDDMVHHTRCVTRATENTFVVADMPFMSYQSSMNEAVLNAGRLLKEGRAQAVKLEGGASVVKQIRAMTEAGIPVQAHIGMTPQSVNAFGGFKVQGKNVDAAKQIVEDALAVQEAGAFSIVLECVPALLAEYITQQVNAITIGIGAGAGCDGQVLVGQDLLGMTHGFKPKFVKRFGEVGDAIKNAYAAYSAEVKAGTFPASPEHTFKIDEEVMELVRRG